MFSNFEWPMSLYFELPPGTESSGHEPALLMFARGHRMIGLLTRLKALGVCHAKGFGIQSPRPVTDFATA